MPISERTQTPISGANKVEEQISEFSHDTGATPVYRLSNDDKDGVPKTSVDMTRLYEWEHGDTIYGTNAKDEIGMNTYIDDINKAWGREKDYDSNMIFVDTLSEKESVSEQLTELKD